MARFFHESELKAYVGSRSFHRGKSYWKLGRVFEIEVSPSNHGSILLTGQVQGNESKPYTAKLKLSRQSQLQDSSCTCPLGANCKHVAALALAFLHRDTSEFGNSSAISIASELPGPAPLRHRPKLVSGAKRPRLPPPPAWLRALQSLTRQPDQSDVPYTLEILLRMTEIPRHLRATWNAPDSRIDFRPRLRNRSTGKTSLSLLPWKEFQWYDHTGQWPGLRACPLPRVQYTLLAHLAHALGADAMSGNRHWLPLADNLQAPTVWHLLTYTEAADVRLSWVTGPAQEYPISLHTREPLTEVLAIRDHQDGIVLRHEMRCNGNPLLNEALFIGAPPIFAIVFEAGTRSQPTPPQVMLYPVETAHIPTDRMRLKKPVVIPASDFAAFSATLLPALMRTHTLDNLSVHFTLPELHRPRLLISVSKSNTATIEVTRAWQYGDQVIPLREAAETSVATPLNAAPEEPHNLVRDHQEEARVEQKFIELMTPHPTFLNSDFTPQAPLLLDRVQLQKMDAVQFVRETLPRLESDDDFIVRKDATLPAFVVDPTEPTAEFEITKRPADPDWFDLQMIVRVGDATVPFHAVFTALAAQEEHLFQPDGRIIPLITPFFQKLKIMIREAAALPEPQSESLRISKFQTGWWQELMEMGVVKAQAAQWQKTMETLSDTAHTTLRKVPKSLTATLRPYQQEGYAWLYFLREQKLGGILADDMGLGKTIQTIALFTATVEESAGRKVPPRFLVIAPTSVVENWNTELARFAPSLSLVVLRAGDRADAHAAMAKAHVAITSYALLHRDWEKLSPVKWDIIIVDEAQMAKNYESKSYTLIRQLQGAVKIALTGTPLENNLMELWALTSLVAPGLFPPPERFRELFGRPIEREGNREAIARLRRRIKPFLLRRTKDVVEKELPKKTEQTLLLDMPAPQRRIYDLHLQKERQRVLGLLAGGGFKKHRFEILTALTRLRQLCLHAALVDPVAHALMPSAKLDALTEQIIPIVAERHRTLIFSQFTAFLAHVKIRLDREGVHYSYLDGSTRDRQSVINTFQGTAGPPVFLISIKAGGFGLNLTAADYCIILDPWWNPAVEAQAIDRAHRIGQTKPVMVYRFIVKNSIEEKVAVLQAKKRALFRNVLDEGEAFSTLVTENDIREMLE